jgi:hypothetical protein
MFRRYDPTIQKNQCYCVSLLLCRISISQFYSINIKKIINHRNASNFALEMNGNDCRKFTTEKPNASDIIIRVILRVLQRRLLRFNRSELEWMELESFDFDSRVCKVNSFKSYITCSVPHRVSNSMKGK